MDFFQHQELARRKTALLVFYFAVATALIVGATYLAVRVAVLVSKDAGHRGGALWDPELFALVAPATLLVICLGSLYRIQQLRGGGRTVARTLGARPIAPNTRDLDERVLLNVVEEMAIASGVPVPPVYVMEGEPGINAFAAGSTPGDAVIGVTRGTLETLTRDQLQGVVAHEFSHILNGDMRLNLRLLGLLHGILLIAITGYSILRALRYVRGSRGKKGGGVIVLVLVLGLAFLVIGWVGVLFGKLIKSAVSRQREYLADASAVQFTRNPDGLAGALKKIGGVPAGSRLQEERAEEVSHMFFGDAVRARFLGMMSTHPPLVERIRRIEPGFDGEFPHAERLQRSPEELVGADTATRLVESTAAIRARAAVVAASTAGAAPIPFQPASAVASVGTLVSEHLDYAADLVASLPERLREAVHEPLGAVATVYCLLASGDEDVRRRQLRFLAEHAGGASHEVGRLLPQVDALGPEVRLPLAGMTVPALCQMSWLQYRRFAESVERLVQADEEVDLFERGLQRMLLRRLAAHFVKPRSRTAMNRAATLAELVPECSCMLSALAHEGHRDGEAAARAFRQGAARLAPVASELSFLPREQCGLKRLDHALGRAAAAAPELKKAVLEAAAACIDSDGRVTVEEGELLRVFADALECPMPPLLSVQVAEPAPS